MPPPAAQRVGTTDWSAALISHGRSVRRATPQASGRAVIRSRDIATRSLQRRQSQTALSPSMLAEQGIDERRRGAAQHAGSFTTSLTGRSAGMLEQVNADYEFDRLVASLGQDAGRAAESSCHRRCGPRSATSGISSPPSCSPLRGPRGRVYRYSEGFQRHPRCDCTMIPTDARQPGFTHDPVELMRQGLVTGLSKADQKAIDDGADLNQVVNVRARRPGCSTAGRVLARRGTTDSRGHLPPASDDPRARRHRAADRCAATSRPSQLPDDARSSGQLRDGGSHVRTHPRAAASGDPKADDRRAPQGDPAPSPRTSPSARTARRHSRPSAKHAPRPRSPPPRCRSSSTTSPPPTSRTSRRRRRLPPTLRQTADQGDRRGAAAPDRGQARHQRRGRRPVPHRLRRRRPSSKQAAALVARTSTGPEARPLSGRKGHTCRRLPGAGLRELPRRSDERPGLT